jgi:hypothetical protein
MSNTENKLAEFIKANNIGHIVGTPTDQLNKTT